MSGVNVTGPEAVVARVLGMRAAQHSVTLMDEFRNTTLFVRTAPYAVLNGTNYNGIYHYNGRADTYFYIGQAFGRGILHLMGRRNEVAQGVFPEAVSALTMSARWRKLVAWLVGWLAC